MKAETFGTADSRMREALAVRFAVFVDEQGVPPEEECDEHDGPSDRKAVHAIVHDGELVVGAGRYYERDPQTAQIGRMAVMPEARGSGVGRLLLDQLMREARSRGYKRARLSAQTHAIAFYEKAGYRIVGEPYDDCGIAHVDMEGAL